MNREEVVSNLMEKMVDRINKSRRGKATFYVDDEIRPLKPNTPPSYVFVWSYMTEENNEYKVTYILKRKFLEEVILSQDPDVFVESAFREIMGIINTFLKATLDVVSDGLS